SERPQSHDLVTALMQREKEALAGGYTGLRTSGNCAWVTRDQWADFLEYERLAQKSVAGRPMICVCSYGVDQLGVGSQFGILECHDLGVPSAMGSPPLERSTNGAAVGTIDFIQDVMDARELRQLFERQKRTFDLAMVASRMGTWRYTLADNICVY